jgi:protein deglycase
MKKVIVFIAEGFEQVEALAPVDLLRRAGFEVITAAIGSSKRVKSSHNVIIETDTLIEQLPLEAADMLFLPGGPGTKRYDDQPLVKTFIELHVKQNKFLAAICAAPSVFGKMGLLKGKKATVFPGYENSLEGAIFTPKCVVVDGNFITGRGAGCSIAFGLALIECLAGKDKANEIAEKILYKS